MLATWIVEDFAIGESLIASRRQHGLKTHATIEHPVS
jgi:hypothetical protein